MIEPAVVDKRDLFEAVKAHYDQVDSAVASVEAKARVWLWALAFFFSAGALSLTTPAPVAESPSWFRATLSAHLAALVPAAGVAFIKLLKSLETTKYEGLPEPGSLLRDYKDASQEVYFERLAEYLSEAGIRNAASLVEKTKALKAGIGATRKVLWILMSLVVVTAARSLWLP